jgi:DnaK suppressor protein
MSSTLMPTPDRRRPELIASLPELRIRLERQRRLLVEQLTALDEPADPRQAWLAGPDRGADRDLDAFMADATRRELGDVEVALHRMATGRYGTCLYCGAELPVSRLLVVPQLDACEECEQELSRNT